MKMKLCRNDSSKPAYVGTKSRVYISIVNKDVPVKNNVCTTSIRYFCKDTDFKVVFL